MNYFNSGPIEVFYHYVRMLLSRDVPESAEKLINLMEEQGDNDAMFKNFLYGAFAGIQAGGIRILLQCLEKRFGALPRTTQQRILRGTIKELESWAERAVDAPDLESVFDPRPPSKAEAIRLMEDELMRWKHETEH